MEGIKIIIPVALIILFVFWLKVRGDSSRNSRQYHNVDASEFRDLMKKQNTVILDVRTANEIAGGKIKGAVEIDALKSDFKQRLAELDPTKTYLVYCRSGRRSAGACQSMAGLGFKNLYNLSGGYISWNRS